MRFRISYEKSTAEEHPQPGRITVETLESKGAPIHASRDEVRAYLLGHGVPPAQIDAAIATLEKQGIVEIE